jgi:hypothetical protein
MLYFRIMFFVNYTTKDLYVGWKFAGLFYVGDEEKDKLFRVDPTLIHDILPQDGSDHEPISMESHLKRS